MKKTSIIGALSAGIITLCSMDAMAVPARPGLFTVMQPDGTEISVRLVGDEYNHYYLSEDGYLLVNVDDTFYYGDVDTSGAVVRSEFMARDASLRTAAEASFLKSVDMTRVFPALEKRAVKARARRAASPRRAAPMRESGEGITAGPGLFPGTSFPSIGEQRAIVILVEYTDVKFQIADPGDYFSRMLNEENFSDYGGTSSARDFFIECSGGKFKPQFDLYGPITLSHPMAYYGGNDYYGNDMRPEEMIIEACAQLDDEVDFSEYDRDGDGYIDNVFVFYAGQGEASGGSSNSVWPHSWDITKATSYPYMYDGVRLDRYACSNEWQISGLTGRPDGVGTFVHEFSHVMGLPDLYATSYSNAFTPGAWSALDYGPYNNDGCTPPLYGAFERYALGWMQPEVIDGPVTITLEKIGTNKACIIPTSQKNEFFLLENRQQEGWDKYIPGHGMLIWHVDYNESIWENNTVNNSSSHQYVDIEEADGSRTEGSRAGDAFPGTAGKTSFTDDTSPSMRTWNNTRLGLPITGIAESADGLITFDVDGGASIPGQVMVHAPENVTSSGFTLSWDKVAGAIGYKVTVVELDGDNRNDVPAWNAFDAGTAISVKVTGLKPETSYGCMVEAYNRAGTGEVSVEVCVTTLELTFAEVAPEVYDATRVTTDSFVASWEPLEGAVEYFVNVYTKVPGEPHIEVCDFTGGIAEIPDGWKTTTNSTYTMNAYSGEAVPSLRMGANGDYLQTCVYDDNVSGISLWRRGSNTTDECSISVYGLMGDDTWERVTSFPAGKSQGSGTVAFDEFPEGVRAVRIFFDRAGAGALAIDDVVIKHGGDKVAVYLPGMESLSVGNETELKVGGLEPGETYYYTVKASNGDVISQQSREVSVVMAWLSGVGSVGADSESLTVTVSGNIVKVSAPSGRVATLYDIAGHLIDRATVVSGTAEFNVPVAGFYIVDVDCCHSLKVVKK